MSENGQDNFGTAEMSDALKDVTNAKSATPGAAPGPDPEAAAKAREQGWVPPQAYDYESYNSAGGNSTDQNETLNDLPNWGHKAARYEWLEEYGDVGPANPELEETLFRGEHQQRFGTRFNV